MSSHSPVTIDPRFCGPATSANGGYACGVFASLLGAPVAEVTLRSPPPLATPLDVVDVPAGLVVQHGSQVVAEVAATSLDVSVPAHVSWDAAVDAARGFPWKAGHPFPRCFVCGTDHPEGLHLFPGPVLGLRVAAAPWVPDASIVGPGGAVPREIVWAALDCPSWFGFSCFGTAVGTPLLGRLAVRIDRPVLEGVRHVCLGWLEQVQGRKHHVASAIARADGVVCAVGRATWITVSA